MTKQIIFTPLLCAALLFSCWTIYRRLSLVRVGRPSQGFRGIGAGLKEMFLYAFLQKRVLRQAFGINHLVFFWGFMAMLLVNGEFLVSGVVPSLRLGLLPNGIYLPIRFVSDIIAGLSIAAVVVALVRRTFAPPYPEAKFFEAYAILILVGIHMIAYLGLTGAEICLNEERAASSMPLSRFVAWLMQCNSSDAYWAEFFWWLHAIALIIFITVLIPFTKHIHVITAIVNCFLHREGKPNTQEVEAFGLGNVYGAGRVDRFTSRDLFDVFACTKCGRCQNVCPAENTGKPLNPRRVVEDIRINLLANGPLFRKGKEPVIPLIGDGGTGSVAENAIWSCITCGACLEACPVFIEQMPKIIQMRRHLVEMKARFPEELLNLFENMEGRSNPWGITPAERTKWYSQLEVKPFDKDTTEYLFYVGCAGSFDSRNKQVSVAMVQLLDRAGVSWGILGKAEKCCGDSVRRLGNEYLFDQMAQENVATFRDRGVKKVITQCPHCFSTLKNDYRQYGIDLEVIHHSELLRNLVQDGRLTLDKGSGAMGTIVYHDSCYLGRHNDVYDAPREVIEMATGSAVTEMGRNRSKAFCCGAGGGRMWMEELTGERINLVRVKESLEEKPNTICVTCPYCMTMFEDGLKDVKATSVKVLDVAEIMAKVLRPA